MEVSVKKLRELTGMSQSQFANYFGMTKYSIQNWEQGKRECPKYLLDLMEYKLRKEEIVK